MLPGPAAYNQFVKDKLAEIKAREAAEGKEPSAHKALFSAAGARGGRGCGAGWAGLRAGRGCGAGWPGL